MKAILFLLFVSTASLGSTPEFPSSVLTWEDASENLWRNIKMNFSDQLKKVGQSRFEDGRMILLNKAGNPTYTIKFDQLLSNQSDYRVIHFVVQSFHAVDRPCEFSIETRGQKLQTISPTDLWSMKLPILIGENESSLEVKFSTFNSPLFHYTWIKSDNSETTSNPQSFDQQIRMGYEVGDFLLLQERRTSTYHKFVGRLTDASDLTHELRFSAEKQVRADGIEGRERYRVSNVDLPLSDFLSATRNYPKVIEDFGNAAAYCYLFFNWI